MIPSEIAMDYWQRNALPMNKFALFLKVRFCRVTNLD
jgi:hypothetical protein